MTNFNINVIVNPTAAIAGTKAVRAQLKKTEKAGGQLQKVMRRVFAFAGLSLGIQQLRKFSDSFIELQNRLRVAGFETDQLAGATAKLLEVSNRTRSPLDANAKLLGRIGIAANDLGASQTDMFRVIELVGKGLAIQGSSAQEARGAIIQLSQAFGSGTVRAEEFNSVAEGAAPILQAVAKAMGTTFSGLKKLVSEGKVASKEFFNALLKGGADLDALFAQVSPTIGQALTVLQNQLIALTGTLETQFGGALSGAASAILFLANNLTVIVPLLIDFGVAVVGVKLAIFGSSLLSVVTRIGSLNRAMQFASKIIPGVAGAMRILNAVMRVNPFFLLASAIGLAITLILQFGSAIKLTEDGTVTLASALQAVINLLGATLGVVLEGWAAILQVVAFLLGKVAEGWQIIAQFAGPVLVTILQGLGPIVPLIAVVAAGFFGWGGTLTLIAGIIASVVIAVFQLEDAIVALFPPAQIFFDFMNEALRIAIAFWEGLKVIVGEAGEKFGLFKGKVDDTTTSLKEAGNAGAVAGDSFKFAGEKANDAFIKARDSIKTGLADAANSGSSSLNTLANNGVNSANRVKDAWNSAASAAASAGSAGGGGSSGSGSDFNGAGTIADQLKSSLTGRKFTFTVVTSALKSVASKLGGVAKIVAGDGPGKFSFKAGLFITGFVDQIKAQLSEQAGVSTGSAALSPAITKAIEDLAKVQSALKQKRAIASFSPAEAKEAAKFGIGGTLGGRGGGQSVTDLAISESKFKKILDDLIRPPSESLEKAASSLETASASLTVAADAPIWLTQNPFEAFRQNVFGFASGGQFSVGGQGGADSKLVNLALTPGERVDIKTPAQQRRENDKEGKTTVNQTIIYNVETPDADSFKRSQTQILGNTLNALASVERRL